MKNQMRKVNKVLYNFEFELIIGNHFGETRNDVEIVKRAFYNVLFVVNECFVNEIFR